MRIPVLDNLGVENPASAFFAEVTFLLASTIARTYEIRHVRVVFDGEEGENGRGAESAGGLLAAIEIMTMKQTKRGVCRRGKLDSAATARSFHDGCESVSRCCESPVTVELWLSHGRYISVFRYLLYIC